MNCPLCKHEIMTVFHQPIFYRCNNCGLVFKDPAVWPSKEEERKRYLKHDNSLKDQGYRDYLLKILAPIKEHLRPGVKCLDYGCGPVSSLSVFMKEFGAESYDYDPCFFNDRTLLNLKYDVVTCNEVIEHFHHPYDEFRTLFGLLNDKGLLVIGTQLVPDDFKNWWYHSDVTHVLFYSRPTLEWIAKRFGYYLALATGSSFIFCKDSSLMVE